jgi:hypothetical protein
MKERTNMLSFEVTAIDIILVISVIVLLVLYWTKLSKIAEPPIKISKAKHTHTEKTATNPQNGYAECPRGFGQIKKIDNDGTVSERCLGCYRIMDCYSESENVTPQLNEASDTNNQYI